MHITKSIGREVKHYTVSEISYVPDNGVVVSDHLGQGSGCGRLDVITLE